MSIVGYLDGTDPIVLTKFVCRGIDTMPISNGFDGHGKNIVHLRPKEVSVIIGYLHKATPLKGTIETKDMLYTCQLHKIPVLLMVPAEEHDRVRELFSDIMEYVKLVDPSQVFDEALNFIDEEGE
jgi:hypothetical protein